MQLGGNSRVLPELEAPCFLLQLFKVKAWVFTYSYFKVFTPAQYCLIVSLAYPFLCARTLRPVMLSCLLSISV